MLTGYKVAPKTISIPKTIEIAPLTIPNPTQPNLLVYPQDLKSTYNIRCRFEWILSVHAASSGHSAIFRNNCIFCANNFIGWHRKRSSGPPFWTKIRWHSMDVGGWEFPLCQKVTAVHCAIYLLHTKLSQRKEKKRDQQKDEAEKLLRKWDSQWHCFPQMNGVMSTRGNVTSSK